MARNKKEKRINLPQETLERARAELRGEIYIPDADDFEDERPEPAVKAASSPVVKVKSDKPASSRPITTSVATSKVKRGATTARRVPAIGELLEEYQYVLRDLRHLAILAVSLLIAIGVLALIISHV